MITIFGLSFNAKDSLRYLRTKSPNVFCQQRLRSDFDFYKIQKDITAECFLIANMLILRRNVSFPISKKWKELNNFLDKLFSKNYQSRESTLLALMGYLNPPNSIKYFAGE